MKVVIMAGGKGSRISSVCNNIPKPLLPIDGRPVLEREIQNLQKQGFKDIILTVSYLSDKIIEYFGNGNQYGVNIQYYIEEQPMGNAGALIKLKKELTEDFLLLNADAIFDIDLNRFIQYHKEKGGLVTIVTHPNDHPYDSGLIVTDKNKSVINWLTKEDTRPKWYKNRVNAGMHIINPLALNVVDIDETRIGREEKVDLDRHILKPLCKMGKVFCYDSPEYIKDMGTPDRYLQVCKDFQRGIVNAKNLKNKQKAIFLDRDGTINEYVGFLTDIEQFKLIRGTTEAIKKINNSGYLAIVVTNQPVIARGDISTNNLDEIHNKMETLLGNEGAYLDDIFYCPHHPDKGYKGEIEELKINCNCRKPKPGLLIKAANMYNINLSSSWMIGDSKNDILAGKRAGCNTALIGSKNYNQDIVGDNLLECINQILGDK